MKTPGSTYRSMLESKRAQHISRLRDDPERFARERQMDHELQTKTVNKVDTSVLEQQIVDRLKEEKNGRAFLHSGSKYPYQKTLRPFEKMFTRSDTKTEYLVLKKAVNNLADNGVIRVLPGELLVVELTYQRGHFIDTMRRMGVSHGQSHNLHDVARKFASQSASHQFGGRSRRSSRRRSRRSSRRRSRSRRSRRACGRGSIRRRSYTRKDGVYVKSSCVKDTGKRGKTPKAERVLPKLTPGRLSRYGYSTFKPTKTRHEALHDAIRAEGYNTILRRLVAISNYNTRTAPDAHAIMRSDIEWAKEQMKPKYL